MKTTIPLFVVALLAILVSSMSQSATKHTMNKAAIASSGSEPVIHFNDPDGKLQDCLALYWVDSKGSWLMDSGDLKPIWPLKYNMPVSVPQGITTFAVNNNRAGWPDCANFNTFQGPANWGSTYTTQKSPGGTYTLAETKATSK